MTPAASATMSITEDVTVKSIKKKHSLATFDTNILKDMTDSELKMIHKLAGNDSEVRRATIKKLRKWLKAIASRAPDSIEERDKIDSIFGRVWKAMFYCMWMADKPLPQETLAEQISSFVSIFSDKPSVLITFVEWFFVTFVREWAWIDRLRLDKFMMLTRRFLRKMLQEFSKHDWDNEMLDQFHNVLTINLFNHHPPVSKKAAKRRPEPSKAPLGFQIHIVNIFLEELAKVGGSKLESTKILRILTPFVNEMAENDDDRLLDEIKARIFHHLMKQSDVGIDYIESKGGTMELMEIDDEADDDDNTEPEVNENKNGPFDPRAGQIDVILPQLDINYEALIEMLKTAATRENTRAKNRKLMLSLAREFQKLTKGQFPLGFERESNRIPAIKRSEIESAAHRLVELEDELKGPKIGRKDKRGRKQEKRQKKSLEASQAPGSENLQNGSEVTNDSDEADSSDLEALTAPPASPKSSPLTPGASKKMSKKSRSPEVSPKSPKNQKGKLKRKLAASITPTPSPEATKKVDSHAKDGFAQKKVHSPAKDGFAKKGDEEQGSDSALSQNDSSVDTYITIKRRRLSDPHNRRPQGQGQAPPKVNLTPDQVRAIYSPIITAFGHGKEKPGSGQGSPKSSKQNGSLKFNGTPALPMRKSLGAGPSASASGGGSASQKKKVNFVLAKNLEHPHSDYQASIERSPAIPYDGKKVPAAGLLKSKSPATPTLGRQLFHKSGSSSAESAPPRKRLTGVLTPRRRKASDFF